MSKRWILAFKGIDYKTKYQRLWRSQNITSFNNKGLASRQFFDKGVVEVVKSALSVGQKKVIPDNEMSRKQKGR